MKKLMFVAAVAAMTGVSFGAACDRETPVTPDYGNGANVYQLQMQLRSTWGAPCVQGSNSIEASLCGRETTNTASTSVLRIPASFVINAWLFNCTNTCSTLQDASVVAWEQNRQEKFIVDDDPEAAGTPLIAWKFLNIIGVSADQAEAEFIFHGKIADYSNGAAANPLPAIWDIRCAGQGTFGKNEKPAKFMFLSGYCAGDVDASYCIQGKICEASKVATCASSLTTCPNVEGKASAVFGRWALRYNTEASVQYFQKGTLNVPAFVQY